MWNLAKVLWILVALLVTTSSAWAVDPPIPLVGSPQPFVKVEMPDGPLNLGKLWASGSNRVSGETSIRVMANCPYHIEASLRGLSHTAGKGAMVPKHLTVVINGEQTAIGGRVVIARSSQPTSLSGVDVPIKLSVAVNDMTLYPAGQYGGTLAITVMAGL